MTLNREPFPKSVRRLWIRLTLVWTIAWLVGLMIFGMTSSYLASRYYDQQIDSRLRTQAIAVYGLAFFNESGAFESDLLDYEKDLFEANTGLWFIEPGETPLFHLSGDGRLPISTLTSIANEVVNSGDDVKKSGVDKHGQPYQLLAIPTYEVEKFDPRAAIIVVTNPSATNRAMQQLLWWMALMFPVLGLAGVVIGALIAKWSLNPLANFISDREKFVSAAAHELRTPMATISAIVEAGTAGTELPAESMSRLGPIVSKATNCLEDLLLYARLDAGRELIEKAPIRLDLLVEAMLPEQSEFKLELEETIILGDERLLQALIRNLLANSLRHATSPKALTIRLSNKVLSFENDGGGFSDEVISQSKSDIRVFSSSTGSGFGLAIAQMIVKLHGGTFRLSNPTPGTAKVDSAFS